MSSSCHIGGIIKHKAGGYGFKISFSDIKDAQRYKEMLGWFVIDEKMVLSEDKGYYDRKE